MSEVMNVGVMNVGQSGRPGSTLWVCKKMNDYKLYEKTDEMVGDCVPKGRLGSLFCDL